MLFLYILRTHVYFIQYIPISFAPSLTVSLFYFLLVPKATIISSPNFKSKLVQSCKCTFKILLINYIRNIIEAIFG